MPYYDAASYISSIAKCMLDDIPKMTNKFQAII